MRAIPGKLLLEPTFPRNHTVSTSPAEPILRAPTWPILRADPALVAKAIDHREYGRIIHLALVWLVPRRGRGNLHVANERKVLFEAVDEIAADNLRVIKIELDAQVRPLHLGNDCGGVLGAGEEIIRAVARIDRLDQERDVLLRGRIGRGRQVSEQRRLRGRTLLRCHLAR